MYFIREEYIFIRLEHRVPYVSSLYPRKQKREQAIASHARLHGTAYLLRNGAAQFQDGAVTRDGQVLHRRYLAKNGFKERNTRCKTDLLKLGDMARAKHPLRQYEQFERTKAIRNAFKCHIEWSPTIDDRARARKRRRLTCNRCEV